MQLFFVEQTHSFHGHYKSLSQKTEQEFVHNGLDVQKKIRICNGENSKCHIPLGQDQAVLLEPTKTWSFQSLEDPKVMSICVNHINHVRNG